MRTPLRDDQELCVKGFIDGDESAALVALRKSEVNQRKTATVSGGPLDQTGLAKNVLLLSIHLNELGWRSSRTAKAF